MRRSLLLSALLGLLVPGAVQAGADHAVSTSFGMPVRMEARLDTTGCTNNPGPTITLSGVLGLGGLGTDMIFRNNEKGTHTYTDESTSSLILMPAGDSLSIPKQPVLGGVGGNPFIWIQLVDGSGRGLSDPIYLGRCVQGTRTLNADFVLPATAVARLAADGCYNNPGPSITLEGDLAIGGVNARFTFANNDNPVGGPHKADGTSTADVAVVPPGHTISFPKQPVLGGVGGNPWISVLFRHGNHAPIGDEFLLGRCVQLSK